MPKTLNTKPDPGKTPAAGKRQVKTRASRAITKLGFDPFERALQLAQQAQDPDTQFERCLAILPFIRPKLKAVDHTITGETTVTINIGVADIANNCTDDGGDDDPGVTIRKAR